MKKVTSVSIMLLVLMAAAVGSAAAVTSTNTSNYQASSGGNFTVLKGTNNLKSGYVLDINASSASTTSTNAIVLESRVNVSAVPNSSITMTGTGTASANNAHWQYNSAYNVYYQTYSVSTAGTVDFTIANGTQWSTTGSSTAINTSSITPSRILAGGNAGSGSGVSVDKLGNMTTNDTYKVVNAPVGTQESFAGPVNGTVTTTNSTVNVTQNSTLMDTITVSNTGKYNTGNETFTLSVSNSLASPSQVAFTSMTNAKLASSSTSGATSTYTFNVQNTSKNASVATTMNIGSLTTGTTVTNAISTSTSYTANVVGHTATNTGPYDVNIVGASAPSTSTHPTATILPLPGFLANLGSLGQLIGFGLLVFNILGTILALYLLSQMQSIGSGTRKAGTVGLPLLAIVSFLSQWALIGYAVVILVVDLYLYYQYTQEQSRSSQSSYNMMG